MVKIAKMPIEFEKDGEFHEKWKKAAQKKGMSLKGYMLFATEQMIKEDLNEKEK